MTRRRSRRATWAPLAVVAPASLAFLAAATMWVNGNDPRVATEPASAAASSVTQQSAIAAGAAPGVTGQDSATEVRLVRLEQLLRLTQAQALILDEIAAAPPPTPAAAAADQATAPAQAPAANQVQPRPVTASRAPAAQAPADKAPAAKAPAAKAPAAQAPAAQAPAAKAPVAQAPAPAPAANTVTGASGA